MYRHTKIVATVGPSCGEPEQLENLLKAGVDVFRLNFSHGELEQKKIWIDQIRELSILHRKAVSILGDLQGPKIRTGMMRGGVQTLTRGQQVIVTTVDLEGDDGIIPTNYQDLPDDVEAGDRILLDDGQLELEVVRSSGVEVHCLVKQGGLLKDRKGINLPGVKVSTPALTTKDYVDLEFAIAQELDWVALSFVRTAAEICQLKQIIFDHHSPIRVIAKIEKPEAVANFSEILAATDGVMVARGDLGVELPSEQVPLIQKGIIRQCNEAGKPVITATQMLESMIGNPRPTRAETSDVANAILDGTDAVMLSGETAAGLFPVAAVEVMDRIAHDVEADQKLNSRRSFNLEHSGFHQNIPDVIGQGACQAAEYVGAAAILAFTQTGSTATLVAKYRPSLPIFAVTPTQQVRRHLALYRGVNSLRVDIEGDTEAQIAAVEKVVLEKELLKPGDVVVITMGSPVSAPGTTNLLKIHRLGTGNFYEVHGAPYRVRS
ncbi:MAG TPA: pyruvate kinase [Pelovirga sp.]|nr:pyruvate kinase [Pelovirga sp.]